MLQEINYKSQDVRVAYRDKVRYTECLLKYEYDNSENADDIMFEDGCLIVTGGTGGLGLAISKYFAMKGVKNICLISRKKLPNQDEWKSIIENDKDCKEANIIREIIEIQETGANVFTRSADVVDKSQMQELFDEVTNTYGSIEGVVHCAGIAGDGFIVNKPLNTFMEVLAPKIIGTKILQELVEGKELKVFILFSSITTLFGGPGQSDYTAANAYLDAFAQYRSTKNETATSINWPAWSETGMAVDYHVSDAQTVFKSVTTAEALSILDEILLRRMSNVVPSEINYEVLSEISDQLPMKLAKNIRNVINRQKKKNQSNGDIQNRMTDLNNITIVGKGINAYTEIELKVAYIYASVLNLEAIDIYESFNSLGGDSMISTEVLKILNQEFGDILDVSDMFSYPTVIEMAEYIESRINSVIETEVKTEQMSNMLEKLESGEIEVEDMMDFFED